VSGDHTTILAALACGAFVAAAEPVAITLLQRAAAVDVPNRRSSHTAPTPRGGGAPIVIGLVAVALLIDTSAALAFATAMLLFGAIGFADDLLGLPATLRLAMQGVGSLAVATMLMHRPGIPALILVPASALIAVWLAGVVNAFNFMDGVNGISGAHALIAGAVYALLGIWRSDVFLLVIGAAVGASALAFLPWNAVRARVFLGDVGSYGLGVALAVLAVYSIIRGIPPEAPLAPLALYLADTGWTLQRRIRSGERWLEPHRGHTYQRLCDLGWSHQRVTLTTAAATLLLCLFGAASLTHHPALRAAADLSGLAVLAVYLHSPVLLGRGDALPEAA
jgi:UDP-GlcNAc:undecaprenyl-phosphate/decaprenyl-phosphate GlcNAc-1-phosphate transferase